MSQGASQPSDCKACPASFVCLTEGVSYLPIIPLTPVDANYCTAGSYCPAGASAANFAQYSCSRGYMCPSSDPAIAHGLPVSVINIGQAMILCEAGTY